MIPNKLYIGTVTISSNAPSEEHLLPDWHLRPNHKIANVEYIRKDALIEWLKSRISSSDGGFIDGLLYLAYKDVIKHLNEM